MLQNDPLSFFFSLPLQYIFVITGFFGITTHLLVISKTLSTLLLLIKNPAFIIGDLILLPLTVTLIALFYANVFDVVSLTSSGILPIAALIISISLTILFALRYKLVTILWLPQGVFFFLFLYSLFAFLMRGFIQLFFGNANTLHWGLWFGVIIAVIAHQALGYLYPKKLFT